jgi:ATP-dependent DNA ligase
MEFIFPPRPKGKISPNQLTRYEVSGLWVAQRKFNGTRVVLLVSNGKVSIFNRHGESPKQFALTPKIINQIIALNLESSKTYCLDAELLHSKTTDVRYKQRIVLFDLLMVDRHLFCGPTLETRLSMLADICRNPKDLETGHGIALAVSENIWLAQTFYENFKERFEEFLGLDEIEGIVLKRKGSRLDDLGRREHEVIWQIRCRKPHNKNYEF